jgi:hypothetical protein
MQHRKKLIHNKVFAFPQLPQDFALLTSLSLSLFCNQEFQATASPYIFHRHENFPSPELLYTFVSIRIALI